MKDIIAMLLIGFTAGLVASGCCLKSGTWFNVLCLAIAGISGASVLFFVVKSFIQMPKG